MGHGKDHKGRTLGGAFYGAADPFASLPRFGTDLYDHAHGSDQRLGTNGPSLDEIGVAYS